MTTVDGRAPGSQRKIKAPSFFTQKKKSPHFGICWPAEGGDLFFFLDPGPGPVATSFFLRSRAWPSGDLFFFRLARPAEVATSFFLEIGQGRVWVPGYVIWTEISKNCKVL